MGTQRLVLLAVAFIAIVGAIFFLKPPTNRAPVLRFITWSSYYPDNILNEFTAETGIKLELSYISSNEELFAKFKAGATGFDLIQPSDYMVRQMAHLGMLIPIDHSKLSNLNHIDDYFKNLPYDPDMKYSVPFTFGTTGIALNTDKVKVPEAGVTWNMLFQSPDFKHTSLLDDMREVFGAAFLWRGLSLNTHDTKALDQARKDIVAIKPKILMFSSEVRPLLTAGEVLIAHAYSVDGVQAHVDNPAIQYFIPKEGGTLWTDNFAIPKSGARTNEALQFINFFLDPKHAVQISTQNHLATPNKTAKEMLPEDQKGNPNLYPPPDVMKRLEFVEDLGTQLPIMSREWTELKS